jgi:predicted transcriptional regulator
MNKQVLISVRPENAVNILNGKKTIELRKVVLKWVLEEIKKGNTVIFNIYVTKGKKDILYKYKNKYYTQHYLTFTDDVEALNGKVVARFDTNIIEDVHEEDENGFATETIKKGTVCHFANVSEWEYDKYQPKYAIYIENLKVFDTPKELIELTGITFYGGVFETLKYVTKTPKNMMTVFVNAHDDNKWYFDTIKL